jgi:hypothetical protein
MLIRQQYNRSGKLASGNREEQPRRSGDSVEAAGADAGVAEGHHGREGWVLVVAGEDQAQAVADGEAVAGTNDGDPAGIRRWTGTPPVDKRALYTLPSDLRL